MLGFWAMRTAFSSEYIVQDDVRQHVFWMQRFVDPALFPNDLIANYFQSVAPPGYTAIYRALAALGVNPLVSSKIIPFALMLLTAGYCFGACLQILPVPLAGFLASLLLSQNLIMADDLNSATPRAFLYPLFVAFLYYLLRRSLLPCAVTIALLGLFYPQIMFLACGVLLLSLVQWDRRFLRLSTTRQDYLFCGVGLATAAIAGVIYLLHSASEFGPAITVAQARAMPEFFWGGRSRFFSKNPFDFWLFAGRSGILPYPYQLLKPPIVLTALLLPWLLKRRDRFPLAHHVTTGTRVLGLTLLASVGLYCAAHLLLFRLHLPTRYVQHSFRIVLALAAGVVLTILLDGSLRWMSQQNSSKQISGWGMAGLLAIVLLSYPATARFKTATPLMEWLVPSRMLPGYTGGSSPELYQFLAQQPKDSLIASLTTEADNVPTFARRSVLVAREYAIPYHRGYYGQFSDRANDLIRAQYSPSLDTVQRFTQKYGIDFWLLNRQVFTAEFVRDKDWLQPYQPATTEAAVNLEQGTVPIVQQAIADCTVFKAQKLIVLQANCVVQPR